MSERRDTETITAPHRRRLSAEEAKERFDRMRADLALAAANVPAIDGPSQKAAKQ